MDAAQNLIKTLMAAVKAVALYPAQHPSRRNPRTTLLTLLTQVSQKRPIEFAIREDTLTVNDEPLFEASAAADELFARIRGFKFTTLRFLPGVTESEIGVFLELFASDDARISGVDAWMKLLANSQIKHIEVEEENDLEGRAVKVYGEATSYIKGLWQETRLGRIPKGDEAVKIVDEMSKILNEDRSPLVGLTMLSDYDNYTFNHSVNVGVFAMALAQECGYAVADAKTIGLGGLLHDVGKTRIPIEIINKPGKLDPDEWEKMQRHPVYSGELVQQMGLNFIFDIVQQHHCGFNRSGYPSLPASKELHEGAMMTAVCDVYDSMTTTRPYQRCYTPQESIEVLFKLRERGHLNPQLVEAFTRTVGIYPVGTCVRLDNGSIAFVTAVYKGEEEQPIVKVFRSARGETLAEPEIIDLRQEHSINIVGTLDPSLYGARAASYVDPAPALAAQAAAGS